MSEVRPPRTASMNRPQFLFLHVLGVTIQVMLNRVRYDEVSEPRLSSSLPEYCIGLSLMTNEQQIGSLSITLSVLKLLV